MLDWKQILSNIPIEQILLIFGLIIVISFFKSRFFKGRAGEFLIKSINKTYLDKEIYKCFDNITFKLQDNSTTQIDHVIVSKYGIFVLETKNLKGWIFGDEKSKQWTQSFKNRKKYKFQNPIHQNYRHIKALQEVLNQNNILQIDEKKFISIITFIGESEFKTKKPNNVFHGKRYINYIKSFNEEIIKNNEVKIISNFIERKSEEKSLKTDKEHVENLKKRHK
jgi:restriction system protein